MEAIRIRTLAKVRPSADCPSPRVETLSTSLENLSAGGADGCGWRDPRSVLLVWRSHLNNEGPPRYLRLGALMACGSDTRLRPARRKRRDKPSPRAPQYSSRCSRTIILSMV